MTPTEYWDRRAALAEELRELRQQRRMVQEIFRNAKNADLAQAGNKWWQAMFEHDATLSREILDLDAAFYGGTV